MIFSDNKINLKDLYSQDEFRDDEALNKSLVINSLGD